MILSVVKLDFNKIPKQILQVENEMVSVTKLLDSVPIVFDYDRYKADGNGGISAKIDTKLESLSQLTATSKSILSKKVDVLTGIVPWQNYNAEGKLQIQQLISTIDRQRKTLNSIEKLGSNSKKDFDGKWLLFGKHDSFSSLSGRLSASNPATMSLPKVIMPYTEYVRSLPLYKVDIHDAEMRILAGISGDKQLIDIFSSGGDLYSVGAECLFHEIDLEKKLQRSLTKKAIISTVYGRSFKKVADELKAEAPALTLNSITEFYQWLHETFHQAFRFLKKVESDNFLWMLNKRTRIASSEYSPQQRRVLPVQGSMALALKLFMIEIHSYVPITLVECQHDAVYISAESSELNLGAVMIYQLAKALYKMPFTVPYTEDNLISIEKMGE